MDHHQIFLSWFFKNETKIWYMDVMDFSKKVFLSCVENQFLKYLFSKLKFKCLIITIYTYITEQKKIMKIITRRAILIFLKIT